MLLCRRNDVLLVVASTRTRRLEVRDNVCYQRKEFVKLSMWNSDCAQQSLPPPFYPGNTSYSVNRQTSHTSAFDAEPGPSMLHRR